MQYQRIHHGREHSGVISAGTVHPLSFIIGAPPHVSTTHNDSNTDTGVMNLFDFTGDVSDRLVIDAEVLAAFERLAAEFQQDAAVAWRRPQSTVLLCLFAERKPLDASDLDVFPDL